MRLPEGPVIRDGELSREWRTVLEAAGGAAPRVAPTAALQREWLAWFGGLGGGVLPRGGLYGPDGMIAREWRVWLEAV